jgi:hypothetical protein
MAKKRKKTGRTPDRGADERAKWIDEQLERRWQALREGRGIAADADPYDARTKLLAERLADAIDR